VDDPLLVRVLDRPADADEEVEPLPGVELLAVAVLHQGHAPDQLHDEVGTTGPGGARVEDLGDAGMVHHRQRLALGLEAGDDLVGVHAQLDDLQGDLPSDRFLLLGQPHGAETALAERFDQAVAADRLAGLLGRAVGARGISDERGRRQVVFGRQEGFDLGAQGGVVGAGLVEVGEAVGGIESASPVRDLGGAAVHRMSFREGARSEAIW